MDWTSIITTVISCGFIFSLLNWIRDRKSDKKIKTNEAAVSDVETQKAKMDLVIKFRDEMVTMVDIVKQANEKNFSNQDQIIEKLSRMDERLEKVEIKMGDIESYLNGPYHKWLASKEKNKEN